MPDPEAQNTRDQLRLDGFDRIDETLEMLLDCLCEALESAGDPEMVKYLPWRGEVPIGNSLPDGVPHLYSLGFELLNIVEERVSSEIRREREKALGAASIRGLWPQALRDLQAMDLDGQQILDVLEDVRVEPVLTAHPTEAKRSSIRERYRALYDEIVRNEYPKYTDRERRRIHKRITSILEILWHTAEVHFVRPDITSELRNAIHYLRDLFPSAVNRLNLHFTEAWRDAGLPMELLRSSGNGSHLTFGTWIGGDRDGHPLVTPEVTEMTLATMRTAAFELHVRELESIAAQLTLSRYLTPPPPELIERIQVLSAQLTDQKRVHEILTRHDEESWRVLVLLMAEQLIEQSKGGPGYASPAALIEDLDLISSSLAAVHCHSPEDQLLHPLRHKLEIFGFHLATLDIRQNSEFHDLAISQLLVAASVPDGAEYPSWPEARRVEFLNAELKSSRPFLHEICEAGPEAAQVVESFRVIVRHLQQWGDRGIGSLIVSMTRQLSDLLGVYLLAREAGLMVPRNGELVCPLQVVPLFETMEDLERSPGILGAFLEHPSSRSSHRARIASGKPDVQQVMLGYSDSNKDCGILAAQCALHRAEAALTATAREHSVTLCFFHGRGGTISRGAGPTHWFMAALPHGVMNGGFRMTEQGETIAQKYANLANATYNLELLLAGATVTTAAHRHLPARPDPCEPFLGFLSDHSQAAYQSFLKADGFIDFYRQTTPIDALENARIGSRPARRSGKQGHSINDLRAIPWVFSWTQARFYLPGWFGVGSALDALQAENPDGYAAFRDGLSDSVFVSYVLTNVETNLASANLDLMAKYASLVTDDALRTRFMKEVVAEFERTSNAISNLFGSPMAIRRPRMAKTLGIREAPLRVLHHQQIGLLREWRARLADGREADAEELLPKLLLSINAIASGLRTTG